MRVAWCFRVLVLAAIVTCATLTATGYLYAANAQLFDADVTLAWWDRVVLLGVLLGCFGSGASLARMGSRMLCRALRPRAAIELPGARVI